jgi:colanic acid/amylovoran biosynthesis glycosyltransferase
MTWLYMHIKFLPPDFESHVVCQWTENLDQFPLKNLRSLNAPPEAVTLAARLKRKLGIADNEKKTRSLLESAIQQRKPDILHSHFGHVGWANSRIAQKYDVRHVVSFYGLDLSYLPRVDPRWRVRYKQMSDRIDCVLCEGPHMARCIAELGVDPKKIQLFRLGIDLERIPFVPRTNSDRPKRFLIQGSFREKKGIPYALEALARVTKDRPDWQITVVGVSGGSEREEAEKRKILRTTQEHNLGDRIQFLGHVPYERMIQEFYRHDVFVSPSVTSSDGDTEGGAPVTLIEAAASGMPVISTTHCDIPFVLSEENREYLVRERDPAALAGAIEALLSRKDWDPITTANRRLAEEELDVRLQTQKLAGIYAGLTSRYTRKSAAITAGAGK